MNPIYERIKRENIRLEKHYGDEAAQYSYNHGKNLITYAAFDDMNKPETMFSLAHELGHYYQLQKYTSFLHAIGSVARMKIFASILLFPFLLWEEIIAWVYAWKICKEEKVSLNGFLSEAGKCLLTYVKYFLKKIVQGIKYLLGIYIGTIFYIRFLLISEEMKLEQPTFIHELRLAISTSSKPQSELVSELFSGLFILWITLLVIFIVLKFVIELIKLPDGEITEKEFANNS